jgi:hypothetical protein
MVGLVTGNAAAISPADSSSSQIRPRISRRTGEVSAARTFWISLYDGTQVVVARTTVPVRDITMAKLERLRGDLAPVFGKEWMQ